MISYPKDAPLSDKDCEELVSQKLLGKGGGRTVYLVNGDPKAVIKVIHGSFIGTNVLEWQIWCAVKTTNIAKLFGECLAISATGRYLVMERLDDITKSDEPSTPTMPNWLQDIKPKNFGRNSSGQIKMRDYDFVDLGSTLAGAAMYRHAWQK